MDVVYLFFVLWTVIGKYFLQNQKDSFMKGVIPSQNKSFDLSTSSKHNIFAVPM